MVGYFRALILLDGITLLTLDILLFYYRTLYIKTFGLDTKIFEQLVLNSIYTGFQNMNL
jgi:hypothetical protein